MSKNIIEYIESVIDKKFETKNKGYDPSEVDSALDEIFEKFSKYIKENKELEIRYSELQTKYNESESKLKEAQKNISVLESKLERIESSGHSWDLVNNRINKLEKNMNNNDDTSTRTKTKGVQEK